MAHANEPHFGLLLHAAKSQPEPQRLLFVFAAAALPDDATAEQKARYERGEGGELEPVMCVDKDAHALTTFEALAAESRQTGQAWQVVFVAGLSGRGTQAPSEAQAERALNDMVEAVRQGAIGQFSAYDAQGAPLSFS
ncbi:MAG: ribonucleotide reductase subunit alpha [Casimicrobiaceae bacterium]